MDYAVGDSIDAKMMQRCLEISRAGGQTGEFPFGAVIARDGVVVAEAANRVVSEGDVTRHAEIVAISEAQRTLGSKDLSGCTLYTIVEPCPMCSFPIRETRISRVVYAIASPLMGGASRWDVLHDHGLSRRMPEAFGKPPEVIHGFMHKEAARVWRRWNPLIWGVIRLRGVFGIKSRRQSGAGRDCGARSHDAASS